MILCARCEKLNAADARDDCQFKINSKRCDRLDDTDRGIVDGWIAPDEEADGAAVLDLGADDLGIPSSAGVVPNLYSALILRSIALPIGSSVGVRHLDEAVVIMSDHRPAEVLAKLDQVVLRGPLVSH